MKPGLIKINYTLMTSYSLMIINLAQFILVSAKRINNKAQAKDTDRKMSNTNLVGFPLLDGFERRDPVLHFLSALGAQH